MDKDKKEKFINFKYIDGKKTLEDLTKYIESLEDSNESLRKQINEFNQEENIKKINDKLRDCVRKSLHILSDKESEDLKSFANEHYKKCKSNYVTTLEGTGIGTAITVKCKKCNEEKDITDVSSW